MKRRSFIKGLAASVGSAMIPSWVKASSDQSGYQEGFKRYDKVLNDVYVRYNKEISIFKSGQNNLEVFNYRFKLQSWFNIIEDLKKLSGKELLIELRKILSNDSHFGEIAIKYVSDKVSTGEVDYFKTPLETLSNYTGDCDDYSLLWYFTLIELGFPIGDLFFTLGTANGVSHACLYVKVGEYFYVLDNMYETIVLSTVHRTNFLTYYVYVFDENINKFKGFTRKNYLKGVFNNSIRDESYAFSKSETEIFLREWLEVYSRSNEDYNSYLKNSKFVPGNFETLKITTYAIPYFLTSIAGLKKIQNLKLISILVSNFGFFAKRGIDLKKGCDIAFVDDRKSNVRYLNVSNYVKTPFETFCSFSGDYKDILILWYFTLVWSGFNESDLFFVCSKRKDSAQISNSLFVRIEDKYYTLNSKSDKVSTLDDYFNKFEFGVAFSGSDGKSYGKDYFL